MEPVDRKYFILAAKDFYNTQVRHGLLYFALKTYIRPSPCTLHHNLLTLDLLDLLDVELTMCLQILI